MPSSNRIDVSVWSDLTQVETRRSFALLGLGAVVGLVLAGYALFTARGTSTLVVPAEDVASVNQQPISRVDYLVLLQTEYGDDASHATREQQQKILNDMIREELFVQRGKELDVASTDPDVRSALVAAVEMQIAESVITARPTEATLQSYFTAHQERYASEGVMTVRDFVFPATQKHALEEMLETLKAGPPAPALLAQLQGKPSGKAGDEEFYFAAKIHLGDRLFDVAKMLPDGALSPTVQLEDGIHVLYMEKNKLPVPYTYAMARDQVLTDYRRESIAHLNTGDESFLRKRANILIADDLR
jgi:hypothetical protein